MSVSSASSPRSAAAAVVALLVALPASAQGPIPGYSDVVSPQSPSASSIAVLGDDVVWYDGQTLFVDAPGRPRRALLSFPTPRFSAFTQAIGPTEVAFAESSFGEVWRVPLTAGATPALLTSVPFAYDAALLGPRLLLVSARTGGFSAATNDLVAIDLVTGSTRAIGSVAGSSGPLVREPNGNLLYANAALAFPPPAASVSVLRWTVPQWATALSGGAMLTDANAQVVVSGLDAAGDLALDGDDDLFALDWLGGAVLEIDDVSTNPVVGTLLSYAGSPISPAGLAFATGTVGVDFEPYAAAAGGELVVVETDYATVTRARRIVSAPSGLDLLGGGSQVPPGAFTMLLQQAAPNGLALLCVGTVATGAPLPLRLPGFEATLAFEPGLLHPLTTGFLPLDGAGSAPFSLTNPGFGGGLFVHAQAVFVTADGRRLGASPLLSLQLQ